MSIIGGFFKKTKHQRFEYKPRFWNQDKEDLEQRIKAAKGLSDNDPEAVKKRISNHLRKNYSRNRSSYSSASKKSTLLLLGIIGVLLVMSYYLLTVYLPLIEESLK